MCQQSAWGNGTQSRECLPRYHAIRKSFFERVDFLVAYGIAAEPQPFQVPKPNKRSQVGDGIAVEFQPIQVPKPSKRSQVGDGQAVRK